MSANLDNVTRHWAQWQPSRIAVVHEDQEISWSSLDALIDSVAGGFQTHGLGKGDRLGILAANSIEWCVSALAALRLGAIVVPLNDRLASVEIERIARHAGCSMIVVDDQRIPQLPPSAEPDDVVMIGIGTMGKPGMVPWESLAPSAPPTAVAIDGDDVAVIAYTSGTTGLPKGVMLTHAAVLSQAASRCIEYGWSRETLRTLLCVPLAVVGGIVTNFLLTLVSGGRLYLEKDFAAPRVLDLIQRERITNMIFVPTIWEALTREEVFDGADLTSLTTAITGGAPVAIPLLETYQCKGVLIHQSYGLTEATSFVSDLPTELAISHHTSAGYQGMHTRVRIVDDEDQDVATGQLGEIVVQGPTVMKGYWNDPEATAVAMRSGWLHTGDIGHFDDQGLLYIVDRKKEMYISGGFNVFPAEVELGISGIRGVEECSVFSVPDPKWGEAGIAVVKMSTPEDPKAVRALCRERLAGYKVPRQILIVDTPLPRNLAGKILRHQVKALYYAAEHIADAAPS